MHPLDRHAGRLHMLAHGSQPPVCGACTVLVHIMLRHGCISDQQATRPGFLAPTESNKHLFCAAETCAELSLALRALRASKSAVLAIYGAQHIT